MSYPVCLVEIFGERETYAIGLDALPGQPYGQAPASDLVRCVTEKRLSYEAPAGTFEIQLTHVQDNRGLTWLEKIFPQDLVVISMMNYSGQTGPRGEGELHTVMVGLVDTVTAGSGVDPRGHPQRQIVVRGRDMGKLFIHGAVTYWTFLGATMLGAAEFVNPMELGEQPHRVLRALLNKLYKGFLRIKWKRPKQDDYVFWDLLGYLFTSYQAIFPGSLDWQFIAGEGSFWSFFQKIASPPFQEFFVDTRRIADMAAPIDLKGSLQVATTPSGQTGTPDQGPTQRRLSSEQVVSFISQGMEFKQPVQDVGRDHAAPIFFFRPPPFPILNPDKTVEDKPWKALRKHVIDSQDMIVGEPRTQQLSRSDREQYNTYVLFPRGPIIPERQYLLTLPPVVDIPRFHKYGYRPLMPHVNMFHMPASDSTNDKWLEFYRVLVWRLAGWTVLNDRFLSGQKTFRLMPHVHIGERLQDFSTWQTRGGSREKVKAAMEFYIERVRHEFIQNRTASTTLGLTRGLPIEESDGYRALLTQEAQGLQIPDDPGKIREFYQNLVRDGQKAPS